MHSGLGMMNRSFCCCLVSKSCPTLLPHGLQHSRLLCPPLSPRVCSNSCPLSQWGHPTLSSSAACFSFCLQFFPAWGSIPLSQHFFASGGQSIRALASITVLPMEIQGWFLLGLTGLISLIFKGLSRIFSSTTVWKHTFSALSLLYGPTFTLSMTTGKAIVLTIQISACLGSS